MSYMYVIWSFRWICAALYPLFGLFSVAEG